MNTTADSSLGEERVHFSLQLTVFRRGEIGRISRQEREAGTEAETLEEHCFLNALEGLGLLSLSPYLTHGHPPRLGTVASGQALPSHFSQKNAHRSDGDFFLTEVPFWVTLLCVRLTTTTQTTTTAAATTTKTLSSAVSVCMTTS